MTHLSVQLFLVLPAAAIVIAALFYIAVRSPPTAVVLLLVCFILSEAVRDHVGLSLTLSGIRVSAMDVLTLILMVVGVYRGLTLPVRTTARTIALAFVFLLVVHFARGVADFGLQDAANHTRLWLYFLGPLVYAATVTTPWDERVWQLIAAAGLVLVLISIPYILTQGMPSATQQIHRNGLSFTSRPIVASGALVILQAAIILFVRGRPSPRASVYLGAFAAAGVVILQHRTVWGAGVAVALVGFVSWSRRRIRDAHALVFGVTGLLFLSLPAAVWGFAGSGTLVASASETTASHSTFIWRTTSWFDLISSHHSLSYIFFGGPAGANWERSVFGENTAVSPHSAYVEAYLRFGVPGFLLLCALGIGLWKLRHRVPAALGLSSAGVALLLITQFLFAITYTLNEIQGLIIGVLVSSLALSPIHRPWMNERLLVGDRHDRASVRNSTIG